MLPHATILYRAWLFWTQGSLYLSNLSQINKKEWNQPQTVMNASLITNRVHEKQGQSKSSGVIGGLQIEDPKGSLWLRLLCLPCVCMERGMWSNTKNLGYYYGSQGSVSIEVHKHSCTFACVMSISPSLLLASACIWVNKFKTELCVCLSQRLKEKHWMGGKIWSDYTHQSVGDLWLMMYVVLCGIWPSYSLPTLIWCRWKIWTDFIDSETLTWRVIILWLCCKYFDHFCHVGQCSDEYY